MKVMEQKDYNDVTIYLLPLIDENITYRDISQDSGFVKAFNSDINRPYLENVIHLMYKPTITKQGLETFTKLNCLDTLYNTRNVIIDSVHYVIFSFTTTKNKKEIISLTSGKKVNPKAVNEIYGFWKDIAMTTDFIYTLFYPNYNLGKKIFDELPEEDYYCDTSDKYVNKESLLE